MKAKNFLTSALMMIMLLFSMAFIGCDLATASPMDNNCSIVSTDHFDPLCVNICAEQSVPANFSFSQELFSPSYINRIENNFSYLNHRQNSKNFDPYRTVLCEFMNRKSEHTSFEKLFSVNRRV